MLVTDLVTKKRIAVTYCVDSALYDAEALPAKADVIQFNYPYKMSLAAG